jgi:hypothetical protein
MRSTTIWATIWARRPWTAGTVAVVLVVGLGLACGTPSATVEAEQTEAGAGAASGADWMQDTIWDDGLAEFAAYDVAWPRYGKLYDGRALLILVKEPWAPDLDVKADRPRPDGFEVLKLNHVRDVATGIYTYHQMSSLFWRRDDGALQKIAATSSEACGISTAQVVDGILNTRSYFDGQGEREQPYSAEGSSEGILAQDGLAVTLRRYVPESGAVPKTLAVFPSLMQARFPPLEPTTYQVERRTVESVGIPAGAQPGVEIRLTASGKTLSYTFSPAPPHVLLRHEQSDGTVYELAKVERIPYWGMSGPGKEEWLPEGTRDGSP